LYHPCYLTIPVITQGVTKGGRDVGVPVNLVSFLKFAFFPVFIGFSAHVEPSPPPLKRRKTYEFIYSEVKTEIIDTIRDCKATLLLAQVEKLVLSYRCQHDILILPGHYFTTESKLNWIEHGLTNLHKLFSLALFDIF